VREPLAAAIFQGGKFGHDDVQKVGFVLAMYAPAIWAYSMQQLSTRAFYALGDSVTPVKVSIWMVALNFALNMVLIWTPLGVGGLALSTAIAAIVQIVIMTRIMHKRMGTVIDRETRGSFARTIAASAAMAGVAGLASIAFAGEDTWLWSVAATLVLAGLGIVTYPFIGAVRFHSFAVRHAPVFASRSTRRYTVSRSTAVNPASRIARAKSATLVSW
jgi:putative peptidoglycan lipid II flippase